jgi:hypothetical protein
MSDYTKNYAMKIEAERDLLLEEIKRLKEDLQGALEDVAYWKDIALGYEDELLERTT